MKRTVKMILALALALSMICALGTTAFADFNTVVTKNPSDETRYVGDTAIFIANASNYDGIEWIFIAPNGTQYKLDAFKTQFPACTVKGQGTTELRIANLQTGLNGWKVFCCFNRGGNCVTTSAASISVLVPAAPAAAVPTCTTYTSYVPYTVCCEPDYVIIDGVRVYSDGTTIVDEDYAPDYILPDGTRVYSIPEVEEDFAPDYILPDGSRVYDLNNYDFEPDYVTVNGARVYPDGSIVF